MVAHSELGNLIFTGLDSSLVAGAAWAMLGVEVLLLVRYVRRGGQGPTHRRWGLGAAWAAGVVLGVLVMVHRGSLGAAVVAGMLGGAWAVRSYFRTTSPLPWGRRLWLLACRLTIICLLMLWALGPSRQVHHRQEVRKRLLIGLDTSASMNRKDVDRRTLGPADSEQGAISRWQALAEAMRANRQRLAHLSQQVDIEYFAFDSSAVGLKSDNGWAAWPGPPGGSATAIGDSVVRAADAALGSGQDIAGVILCSDGASNLSVRLTPWQMASLLGSRGTPVHALGVGSDQPVGASSALTVRDLSAPDEVDAFNTMGVSAVVEAQGLAGRRVQVQCRFADELVDERVLEISEAVTQAPVAFTHTPLAAGYHRLAVTARLLGPASEQLAGSPTADKLVRVVDRELRVLYLEGQFRTEAKFIGLALAGAKRFSVERRILGAQPVLSGPGALGQRVEDWLGYHAIILGDVGPESFTPGQLELLKTLVGQYGKGLAMIGGRRSFGAGGWQHTPLADVMGIDLSRSTGQTELSVEVRPTPAAQTEELMQIDPLAPAQQAWKRLRPLSGAHLLGPAKPAAQVLAVSQRNEPMIVVQQYGKGRSVAVAFDTTWRWVLSPDDTAELQKRFWRQLAMYLAAPKGNAWILTDRTGYDLRQLASGQTAIEVTAGVEDALGRPLADAKIDVTLTGPDGQSSPVRLSRAEVGFSGSLGLLTAPGVYTLSLSTEVDSKPLQARHQFELVQRDVESLQSLANLKLLRELAAESSGQYQPLAKMGSLLEAVAPSCSPSVHMRLERRELRNHLRWPIGLAVVALLCWEWCSRKKQGLV